MGLRHAEEGLDLGHAAEAHPVGADALRPRDQDHVLDRAAPVGDRDALVLHDRYRDRERRPRGVVAGHDDLPDAPDRRALFDDDEVPRLEVLRARGEPARLDDSAHDVRGHRPLGVPPDREHRPDRFEDVHVSLRDVCH